MDTGDISKIKASTDSGQHDSPNEKDFDDDLSGGDLDFPAPELEDAQEIVGNENEEINYYSLDFLAVYDLKDRQSWQPS